MLSASRSSPQRTARSSWPSDAGSRSQRTSAPANTPAITGYDHELIAYSAPSAMAAHTVSSSARTRGRARGPASATCTENAADSSVNGSASTCACRSPSRNENHGNSLIVPGTTREGANQS